MCLDLYFPNAENYPIFVYFHGGGIEAGDKSDCYSKGDMFKDFVDNGVAVASVNYRMYLNAKYPEFILDAAASVKWVRDNVCATNIFVGGSSAGAYLSMMLEFDIKYFNSVGLSRKDVKGYVHEAGQPTTHFNVLRERGVDSRRVIIDEAAPLYHIGLEPQYPNMLFIVSDNDMKNRYEQTMLVISTLKHFGHEEKTELKFVKGKHCVTLESCDENDVNNLAKAAIEFIYKHN